MRGLCRKACGFESHYPHHAPLGQLEESPDSKPGCCGFESHVEHQAVSQQTPCGGDEMVALLHSECSVLETWGFESPSPHPSHADVMKLVDLPHSECGGLGRAGSSPVIRTDEPTG